MDNSKNAKAETIEALYYKPGYEWAAELFNGCAWILTKNQHQSYSDAGFTVKNISPYYMQREESEEYKFGGKYLVDIYKKIGDEKKHLYIPITRYGTELHYSGSLYPTPECKDKEQVAFFKELKEWTPKGPVHSLPDQIIRTGVEAFLEAEKRIGELVTLYKGDDGELEECFVDVFRNWLRKNYDCFDRDLSFTCEITTGGGYGEDEWEKTGTIEYDPEDLIDWIWKNDPFPYDKYQMLRAVDDFCDEYTADKKTQERFLAREAEKEEIAREKAEEQAFDSFWQNQDR